MRLAYLPFIVLVTGCMSDDKAPFGAVGGSSGTNGSGGSAGSATAGGSSGDGGQGVGGGTSGAAGQGGASAGTGGSAGVAGSAGASGSGGSGGGTVVVSDEYATDVMITVHEEVNTILVVTWTQAIVAETTWLEFTFEAGSVMTSRPKPGIAGAHQDVVLGAPSETDVTIRIVSQQAGVNYTTQDYMGTTDALPASMPLPEVLAYDAELASPDRWMLGAVEDSDGGCNSLDCYYQYLFWIYIMDRTGRIVWYYADPAGSPTSSFQRIARDGEYLWIEKRPFSSGGGNRRVLKTTLDREYSEEIDAEIGDCIDVTDDGSLLYNIVGAGDDVLVELAPGATQPREIWNCTEHFSNVNNFSCYSNTVNWNPLDDTVVMSFPYQNTVIEVARSDGTVVGQYGDAPGSYAFEPSPWNFEFQHFANITPAGTLLVSTHMPGYSETESPVAGQHAFIEWTINHDNQTLTQEWLYNDGDEWAMYKGMAIRLPNGNTLANYGTGGVIREITPDLQTAFHVKFDAPNADGTDFFNKMVGHNVLLDDLYALNGGGPVP